MDLANQLDAIDPDGGPGMTAARFPRRYSKGAEETVLVFARESGRGKDSGIEVRSRRITGVYELRDGKIVRFKAYLDRAEALQAAGLRE